MFDSIFKTCKYNKILVIKSHSRIRNHSKKCQKVDKFRAHYLRSYECTMYIYKRLVVYIEYILFS